MVSAHLPVRIDRTREHNWALIGTPQRLGQIEIERAVILKAFRDLRRASANGSEDC